MLHNWYWGVSAVDTSIVKASDTVWNGWIGIVRAQIQYHIMYLSESGLTCMQPLFFFNRAAIYIDGSTWLHL